MNAEREVIDVGTLAAQVEDANLRIRHTTVESRLWVRLVFAVAVASCRATSHFDGVLGGC